ncbi:MAG: hypothetical protein AAF614_15965 [Chloroflexota bacterium]
MEPHLAYYRGMVREVQGKVSQVRGILKASQVQGTAQQLLTIWKAQQGSASHL